MKIVLNTGIAALKAGEVVTECTYTGQTAALGCDDVVMVASRLSDDALYHELVSREAERAGAGNTSVKLIGDAAAPGPIAWATYAGPRYARELDMPEIGNALPFRREVAQLA